MCLKLGTPATFCRHLFGKRRQTEHQFKFDCLPRLRVEELLTIRSRTIWILSTADYKSDEPLQFGSLTSPAAQSIDRVTALIAAVKLVTIFKFQWLPFLTTAAMIVPTPCPRAGGAQRGINSKRIKGLNGKRGSFSIVSFTYDWIFHRVLGKISYPIL